MKRKSESTWVLRNEAKRRFLADSTAMIKTRGSGWMQKSFLALEMAGEMVRGSEEEFSVLLEKLRRHRTDNNIAEVALAAADLRTSTVLIYSICSQMELAMQTFWSEPDKDGKHWSIQDVERAVTMRAEGWPLEAIAFDLKRSTVAVSSKISQAIGIRQLEISIAGLIDGVLDGDEASGRFVGTLKKDVR